ncbi:hypothetical protein C8Q75DRAFT_781697 [Abortiporus biennis]|nr:hypothetical protein C8Q75DRAFT_781697 [Abortiporus biennis]
MAVPPSAPPLSSLSAHLLAASFAISYVGSLYLSKHSRLRFSSTAVAHNQNDVPRQKYDGERWRDDPDVIRARLTAVTLSTLLSCATIGWVLNHVDHGNSSTGDLICATLYWIGLGVDLSPATLKTIFLSSLITVVLFLGPLYGYYLDSSLPFQSRFSFKRDVYSVIRTWIGWRNYIIAPITEEVVFRACVLAVYHMSGASVNKMIFLSPLWFGVAHMHHAWDVYNRFGRTTAALRRAILGTCFQLTYTSLFGSHVAYLFLRTGSILPPITAHIFCNVMGFPALIEGLARYPKRRYVIWFAYTMGAAGYVYTRSRWSENPDSPYWNHSF